MENATDDWSQYLDCAVFAINTSVQKSTKFTPFKMMFGREVLFPLEAEKKGEQCSQYTFSEADCDRYIAKLSEKQRAIFEIADERIKISQEKQKEISEKKRNY